MVQFTQYLRPDGAPRRTSIARGESVERKARELVDMGLKFEAEVLSSGHVHLAVGEFSELAANGPDVPLCVDRLVERVYAWRSRP